MRRLISLIAVAIAINIPLQSAELHTATPVGELPHVVFLHEEPHHLPDRCYLRLCQRPANHRR